MLFVNFFLPTLWENVLLTHLNIKGSDESLRKRNVFPRFSVFVPENLVSLCVLLCRLLFFDSAHLQRSCHTVLPVQVGHLSKLTRRCILFHVTHLGNGIKGRNGIMTKMNNSHHILIYYALLLALHSRTETE